MSTGTSVRTIKPGTKVLIADPLNERGAAIIKEGGLAADTRPGLSESQLREIIGEYDGLIVRSATTVTAKIIAAGKKLQIIGRAGVGVDNIDLKAATAAGIIVQNTPLGNITSAAEHAIALLFAVARNIARADREMKGGKWNKKGLTGVELTGKVLGIVGMGRIGREVTARAGAFGCSISYYDVVRLSDVEEQGLGVRFMELDELLAAADVVCLHAPLTEKTVNLIDARRLGLMKPAAVLVNVARGEVVDEQALASALRENRLAGAVVDVFVDEPISPDNPLIGAPNTILTPHTAGATNESRLRIITASMENVVRALKGERLHNVVNGVPQ